MSGSASKLYTDIICHTDLTGLLTEQNQVSITRDAGNRTVKTTARGWAGITPGAGFTRVQIRSAVPTKGVEYDPGADMAGRRLREFTFFRAGKQLTFKGYVMNDSSTHAADAESELNFDIEGPFAQWQ